MYNWCYPKVTLSYNGRIINGHATTDKVKTHIDSVEMDIIHLGMGFLPRVINMEWVARSFAYNLAKGVFWRCMGKADKLIKITSFNTELNRWLGTEFESFEIYRSKGLLTHLINRKHFVAAKYIDYLPDLISSPDYIGIHDSNIEMVKCYKDNIFISVKLDTKKSKYYVATVFDVKQSKIDSYLRSGRLIKIDAERNI